MIILGQGLLGCALILLATGLAVIQGRDYFLKGPAIRHFPKLGGLRQGLVMK